MCIKVSLSPAGVRCVLFKMKKRNVNDVFTRWSKDFVKEHAIAYYIMYINNILLYRNYSILSRNNFVTAPSIEDDSIHFTNLHYFHENEVKGKIVLKLQYVR